MRTSCESLIVIGETFIIKNFGQPAKPILAQVRSVDNREDWQLVSLFTLGLPKRSKYDMSTRRRLGYGIYTSSNGSLLYLRYEIVGSKIPGYFSQEQLKVESDLVAHQ